MSAFYKCVWHKQHDEPRFIMDRTLLVLQQYYHNPTIVINFMIFDLMFGGLLTDTEE